MCTLITATANASTVTTTTTITFSLIIVFFVRSYCRLVDFYRLEVALFTKRMTFP